MVKEQTSDLVREENGIAGLKSGYRDGFIRRSDVIWPRIGLACAKTVEIVTDFLQVFAGLFLLGRITQQVGRMKGGHDFDAAKVLELSADATDSFPGFEQITKRSVAEHDDHI